MKQCVILGLLYCLLVGLASLNRLEQANCAMFDLGIHSQAVWLVSQGENPFLSTRGLQVQADHFSPMVYLLAPLYWIWADPRMLLVFQTLWLASGVIPCYWLARHHQLNHHLSLALGALYLCQPCLAFANLFDFHFSTLLSTPLLWACYALERRRHCLYWAALLTALTCSETAAISLVGLIPLSWLRWNWRQAAMTACLAVGAALLSLAVIRWHNAGQSTQYKSLYSHLGRSGGSWSFLMTSLNRDYLLQMVGPLAFLPVLGPLEVLPAAPVLAGNLLSWRESQHTVKYHYMAGILPFLMWSAVVAARRLQARLGGRRLGWLMVLACPVGLLAGPLHPEEWRLPQPQRAVALRELGRLVPPQASLSVENSLGGAFCQRAQVYLFPNPLVQVAWGSRRQALIDQTSLGFDPPLPGAWRRALEKSPVQYLASETAVEGGFPCLSPDRYYLLCEILASSRYRLVYASNGAVLFVQDSSVVRKLPARVIPPSDWSAWQAP